MPKRRRPRVWDDAQVIAWIVHKTERAVNDAEGMLKAIQAEGKVIGARNEGKVIGARKRRSRKAPLAFQLAISFEAENPYFADGTLTAGRVAGLYKIAEAKFKGAIAGKQLKRNDDRLFNGSEVKALWPGSGRGNSKKPFFNRALVDNAAAVIACGPDGQTRRDVFCKLEPKGFAKQEKQSALLRAATDKAIRYLKSGEPLLIEPLLIEPLSIEWGHPPESALVTIMPSVEGEHPLIITPSEAKGLLNGRADEDRIEGPGPPTSPDLRERDRKSLVQLARMKQLSPRERKAQIQRVKAFKKRTLRGLIAASN